MRLCWHESLQTHLLPLQRVQQEKEELQAQHRQLQQDHVTLQEQVEQVSGLHSQLQQLEAENALLQVLRVELAPA